MFFYLTFSLITIWLAVLGWYDCCSRRLPNVLTLSGAAVFLLMRFVLGGTSPLLNGLLGGAVGAAFMLLPFLLRGAGAGDLKMFFAVGCLTGYPGIFLIMVLSSVLGVLLGLGMLIAARVDLAKWKHWFRCCTRLNYDREAGRKALPPKNKKRIFIPFGTAIAAGTWLGIVLSYAFQAK